MDRNTNSGVARIVLCKPFLRDEQLSVLLLSQRVIRLLAAFRLDDEAHSLRKKPEHVRAFSTSVETLSSQSDHLSKFHQRLLKLIRRSVRVKLRYYFLEPM